MSWMPHRVDLGFLGSGAAARAYGGRLRAWSFAEEDGETWLSRLRAEVLGAMGKRYLPIYRMADGEFRFLMGRRYNLHRRPLHRELIGVTAEKLGLKNPDKWATSWGEQYEPSEVKRLRAKMLLDIAFIASRGYLACYINDNGLHAFTEYNNHLEAYFSQMEIDFTRENYVPFHLAVALFSEPGWERLIAGQRLLVLTGAGKDGGTAIQQGLLGLGARSVEYIPVSPTRAQLETVDLEVLKGPIDLCLVAAGVGAANILRQLEPLRTAAIDIGGFVSCFADPTIRTHGGTFGISSPQKARDDKETRGA